MDIVRFASMLDDLVQKGRHPRGREYLHVEARSYPSMALGKVCFKFEQDKGYLFSIHEICSKESGLLEMIERRSHPHAVSHYMQMGPMTEEEKLHYIFNNMVAE